MKPDTHLGENARQIEVSAEIRPLLESREHPGAADLTL